MNDSLPKYISTICDESTSREGIRANEDLDISDMRTGENK